MSTTVKEYYDYTQPREKFRMENMLWDGAAPTTVTLQPSGDEAEFVQSIQLLITDTFAMTALDVVTITVNAYGTTVTYTMTATATVADDLATLISWGDAKNYKYTTVGAVGTHIVVIEFTPPVYLRTSTTPSESVVMEYTATGGGVTAGNMQISTKGWVLSDEDNSGI